MILVQKQTGRQSDRQTFCALALLKCKQNIKYESHVILNLFQKLFDEHGESKRRTQSKASPFADVIVSDIENLVNSVLEKGKGQDDTMSVKSICILRPQTRKFRPLAAFTLAEVLITLGIIGIVSAMTIPTLITNYQKQATATRVKKVYSMLSQAIEMAKVENGPVSSWTCSSAKEFYDNYLTDVLPSITPSVAQGLHGEFVTNNGVKITLKDGAIVVLGLTNPKKIIVYFKTPTELFEGKGIVPQKDRFYFNIDSMGRVVPPRMDMTREQNITNCESYVNSSNNGYEDCSTVILKDNWEIKDDYPW